MKIPFKQKKLSATVYKNLCKVLDEDGVKYTKNKKKLSLNCIMRGKNTPVGLNAIVDANPMILLAMSPLVFVVPKERRDVVAVAVSDVNAYLSDGHFDFNYQTGEIVFRIVLCFANSIISKQTLRYITSTVLKTVDSYNDKLMAIATNDSGIEDALKLLR